MLSIVVPTRNRVDYAISAIKSILCIPSNELELVIQDSGDSTALENKIRYYLSDPRLHYNYSKPPISGIDNFNLGARLATGDYLAFIGDDDGVNPEILAATQWARLHDLDALTPTLPASYLWPDFATRYRGLIHAGRLYVRKYSGTKSFFNPETEIRKCARFAGQNFVGLPKIYYGIVKRRCLEQVYERAGVYFNGASPDMYSALALANFVERMCVVDYPLFVPGSSGSSMSGISAKREHVGRLEDISHLNTRVVREWPEIIPRFFSVETVWAESAIEALKAMHRSDILHDFNFPLLHAKCTVAHIEYLYLILPSLCRAFRFMKLGYVSGSMKYIKELCGTTGQRVQYITDRLLHPSLLNGATCFSGLIDIEAAIRTLTNELKKSGRTFEKTVGA